jgi:catechol 2,3-dioxygenase-like lactoylglutathione lyase family enzyme
MLQNLPVAAAIAVADISRARQFYEGVLGLIPRRDTPDGIEYACGGGTAFLVYQSGYAGSAQNTVMEWQAANFDAVIGDLRARGVVFEEYDFPGLKTINGVADLDGEKAAWFRDPDGNILSISTI